MLKSLLSVCSIFVLLLQSVFLPVTADACPVKLPETLLSLYRKSDAIYVGRFDKVEDQEIIENSEERTVLNIHKHFDISSALKGDSRKLFVLEQREYRYKAAGDESEQAEEEDEDPYRAANLRSGDLVLLFLKKGTDVNTLELADYRDAIKKMTPDKLAVYETRIRELNSLFAGKKADDAAVVDWLVRCIDDPLTRWEGAFELQQSFQQFEWMEEQKADSEEESEEVSDDAPAEASEATTSEDAEVSTEAEVNREESGEADNSVYARLLSDSQRQRLMNILVASTEDAASEPGKLKNISAGDKVLIELVSKWGDNRFARYLLDRVQATSGDPYLVSELMSHVAEILDDKDLGRIVEKYARVNYEDDMDIVEEDDDSEAAEDSSTDAAAANPSQDSSNSNTKSETEKPPVPKITYKQLREELLANFLERSVTALAIAEANDGTERASR